MPNGNNGLSGLHRFRDIRVKIQKWAGDTSLP